MAQTVKCLPTTRETQVQSLGQEDLLEKEMATHSSILAWRIPWTESLVGYNPQGRKELDTTERLHLPSLPTMLLPQSNSVNVTDFFSVMTFHSALLQITELTL